MKWVPLAAFLAMAGCSNAPSDESGSAARADAIDLQTSAKIPLLMETFGVSGLAVTAVSGDTILLSKGFGKTQSGDAFTDSTRCGLFSATKALASLTYAKLDEQGLIDLNAPLGSYIEDAPADWADIPFYSLLNHSSGITMVVNKGAFEDLTANPLASNADIYALIREEPLDYETGTASRYRQSGYAIGEMILEERLDKPFAELVDELVVAPAELSSTQHPAMAAPDQAAILLSAGGYETTAEDMGKLFVALNDGSVLEPTRWKTWLLTDTYRFGDYSLGSIIEERNGVLTVGHRGGGARANLRYAPDEKVGVMVCTDDRSNNEIAISLAQMLIAEMTTGEAPPLPLWVALSGYSKMSGQEVIAAYQSAKRAGKTYDLSESEAVFNQIGYGFLADEKTADAIEVFAFNVESFPDSPNAHDSLGEALLTSGDTEASLKSYRHVLKLDPGNANATKMIAGILRETKQTR
ncbi:MAG: serine hydrolase [Pseudomonadota bacterium]